MPAIPWRIPLGTTNYMILGAGIAVIILGYILMATGNADDPVNNAGVWDNPMAVTIAPIKFLVPPLRVSLTGRAKPGRAISWSIPLQ